ncbi:hypothetical protein BJX76DRAFT_301132 [Aspergillus varians]
MSQPRIPYGQEDPPAYNYGGSYLSDHDESPTRHSGPTMRLLPTSSQVEAAGYSQVDSDLGTDLGAASTYQYGDPFGDDNQ